MGRTLYLNESGNKLTVVRDGPSVWIKAEARAGQRIPVRFLGRVIVIGNVTLDAGAITLFTESDIPVVFMNPRAEEVAMAIPYNHKLATHYEEQKVFLASDENVERFEQWAGSRRAVGQMEALKRLCRLSAGQIRYGIGEGNYQQILARLKPASGEKWMVATGVINNLFRGLITEHLLKADLDPHVGVIHRRHNFGLVLDICHIMGAEGDLQALQLLKGEKNGCILARSKGGWFITDEGMRNIVHRFENRRKALHVKVECIIDELFELMRELRL